MPEYIKRETLIEIAAEQGHVTIDDIINEPAADVAPVRHGQWEWCKDCDGDSILVCSECGRVCHEEDALYCYCGAKMDGKSNVPRTEGE